MKKKENGHNFERTEVGSQQLLGVFVCPIYMSLSQRLTVSELLAFLFLMVSMMILFATKNV